jgi:hypothetical protein
LAFERGGAEQQRERDAAGDEGDVEPERGAAVTGGELGEGVVGVGDWERVRSASERTSSVSGMRARGVRRPQSRICGSRTAGRN